METGELVDMETGNTVDRSTGRHVQVCVWLDPAVANAIEETKALLLVENGIKTTKSRIVEVALRQVLSDRDLLRSLLEGYLSRAS